MHGFEYSAPASVADAATAAAKEDAKLLAGGQTLLPTMKQRLAAPTVLVDLRKVDGLSGISREGDMIVIGAMTRHADVAASPVVHDAIKGLGALAGLIGDPAVRHRGTIGGSLANNDPAADYPAAALALGATIVTNKREIKADDFFQGLFDDRAGGQRDHHESEVPDPREVGLREVPQSGLALCDGRRVRRQDQGRRARGGDRRRLERRVPADRHGEGAGLELLGRRDQGDQDRHLEHAVRPAWRRRIPRPSRQRDGAPRGGLGELTQDRIRLTNARPPAMPEGADVCEEA